MRHASHLYRSQAMHLMQVAAGYDGLAERAYRIRKNAERVSVQQEAIVSNRST